MTSSSSEKPTGPFPDLTEPVTSFGAAILGDFLYVYGGHRGHAHSYSRDGQARRLRRLNLKHSAAWETLIEGPPLQGLAMVARGARLYRIGGFTARNAEGEENDLWSQADVVSYDPDTGSWEAMPPLPEPRSSFDAAVLDGKIYVVGGWQLTGGENATWLDSAYSLDLTEPSPVWRALPSPPFRRRALSVAAHHGKLFVIGGMQQEGSPTTRTEMFDPESRQWSHAPNLQGEDIEGFGSSAFSVGGRLYVSTYGGSLQRLSADGAAWEVVRQLEHARFFHRMLPLDDQHLIFVGGASMSVGKFAGIDVVRVNAAT